jgi:hypothetical protein
VLSREVVDSQQHIAILIEIRLLLVCDLALDGCVERSLGVSLRLGHPNLLARLAFGCWLFGTRRWRAGLAPSPGLKRRGLNVRPELSIADRALGFWKAAGEIWPTTRERRCWTHKPRTCSPSSGLQVDAIDPHIHVAFRREIALLLRHSTRRVKI